MTKTDAAGVSVIVVNWNGIKWLNALLNSLESQNHENLEVIVVDNNSSDESVEFIQDHFKKVKVIQSGDNLGFARGNNLGIKYAKNPWIMLLNSDTWVKNNFVSSLVKYAESSGHDVVGPREADYSGENARAPYITTIDPLGHPVYLYGKSIKNKNNFFLTGVCLLFKKTLYLETNGLDENFFMYVEEIDWFWRLNLMNKKFSYAPNVFVNHAGAGSSNSKSLSESTFKWRNENTLQMLLKNYSLKKIFIVVPLYLLQNIFEVAAFTAVMKPKIAYTYLEGWKFNIKNISKIQSQRKAVNTLKELTERQALSNMYRGSGKARHLRINIMRRINAKSQA